MLEYEYCSTCNSDTISFPSKAKAYITRNDESMHNFNILQTNENCWQARY